MSDYHGTPPDPSVVRAIVRRARLAFLDGETSYLCAQRFAGAEGPALYVMRRTEAEAAATALSALTSLGPLAVTVAPSPTLPTFAAGMTPETVTYQLTRST